VTPGNRRRNSITADNSPSSLKNSAGQDQAERPAFIDDRHFLRAAEGVRSTHPLLIVIIKACHNRGSGSAGNTVPSVRLAP
jgi:hypothetical protein